MAAQSRSERRDVTFGLLLPHFGHRIDVRQIVDVAVTAERYGFAAVWVRDRLLAAAPHGLLLEAQGTSFLEPMLTLASVAPVTERLRLGTAVLTQIRHPVKLLQDIGTLWQLSHGRVTLGVGLGVSGADLAAVGYGGLDRKELFTEYMEVLRLGLGTKPVTFHGMHVVVDAATIDPAPDPSLPIYYGGTSRAAVRRAFAHGQGWIAGRLPIDTFADRMRLVRRLADEHGKNIEVATMPITVVDEDARAARRTVEDVVPILAHSAEGATSWMRPPSGGFTTIEDLSGLLIAGSPQNCVDEVGKLAQIGVGHVVFDLRVIFDRLDAAVALLGERVLPAFR